MLCEFGKFYPQPKKSFIMLLQGTMSSDWLKGTQRMQG